MYYGFVAAGYWRDASGEGRHGATCLDRARQSWRVEIITVDFTQPK